MAGNPLPHVTTYHSQRRTSPTLSSGHRETPLRDDQVHAAVSALPPCTSAIGPQLTRNPCQLTDLNKWRQYHPNRGRTRTSPETGEEGLDVKEGVGAGRVETRHRTKKLQECEVKPRRKYRAAHSSTVSKPTSSSLYFLSHISRTPMTNRQNDRAQTAAANEGTMPTDDAVRTPQSDRQGLTNQLPEHPPVSATAAPSMPLARTASPRPGSPCRSPINLAPTQH